jgi:hypothetical protein
MSCEGSEAKAKENCDDVRCLCSMGEVVEK